MFKKKRQLEMTLQDISPHKNPRVELEQYSTPSVIAADLLWNAMAIGDIEGLKLADLGCGTGIFTIGAALLGANEVVGVDTDSEAVFMAETESSKRNLENTRFVVSEITDFTEEVDTVIQNPPFGAQKSNKTTADVIFLDKALEISPVVYSFHLKKTLNFLLKFVAERNAVVSHKFEYKFPIPKIYDFHTRESVEVEVVVLRIEKNI
ncbi:MAG: METTL5 family protein [Methanobacterium sp. ERen5]|nr:MAG: METTL5 family protein [Methanobacterium sp. ERen5]